MVEVRANLVRAEVIGRTAIELGEAGHGSDIGFLSLGSKPLQLHVVDHLDA
jgi:hypothetical protein